MAKVPSHGLRHEAGLNAGRVLPLEHGRYAFGPKSSGDGGDTAENGPSPSRPGSVTFELEVGDRGVELTPVGVPVSIDGRPVLGPTPLYHGQIVEAGFDRFTLEPHGRPLVAPAAPRRLVAPRLEPLPSPGAVRRRRSKRQIGEVRERRQRRLTQFEDDLEKSLRSESMGRRKGVALPVDVTRSAEKGVAHTLTGSGIMAVGLTVDTIDFDPKVGGDTSGDVADAIQRYRRLSSVPYLVDFNHHRLGLVGPREATLAVSRHLLTANATSSEPWVIDLRVAPQLSADWGPLATLPVLARPIDRLLVLDGVEANLDPTSAIAIATTQAALPIACSVVLTINDDGSANIVFGDNPPLNIVPLGIGADHAEEISRQLQQSDIDQQPVVRENDDQEPATGQPITSQDVPQQPPLPVRQTPIATTTLVPPRPDHCPPAAAPTVPVPARSASGQTSDQLSTGAVLVTGADPATTTEVLSSLAVDLLIRPENRNLTVHVIDAGDRSLIRLRQLNQTMHYAPVDDLAAIDALLSALERGLASSTPNPTVLIANQIGALVAFLKRMDRQDLVDRFTSLVGFHDRVRLLVAASGPRQSDVSPALLEHFVTRLRCDSKQNGRLATGTDERTISISGLSGHDLTSSVASLVSAGS